MLGVALSPVLSLRMEAFIPGLDLRAGESVKTLVQRISNSFSLIALIGLAVLQGMDEIHSLVILSGLCCTILIAGVTGIAAVDNASLIARNESNRLAVRNSVSGILAAILQILGGLLFPSFLVLVVSLLLGRILALILTSSWKSAKQNPVQSPLSVLRSLGGRGVVTAIFAAVVGNLSPQVGLLAMASGLGPSVTGQFAIAQRASMAPATLFGAGYAQQFSISLGEVVREKSPQAWAVTKKQLKSTVPMGLLIAILLVLFGLFGFELVFGDGWELGALMTIILGPALCLQVSLAPLSNGFALLGRQKTHFWIEIVKVLFSIFVFAGVFLSGKGTPVLFTMIFGITIFLGHVLFFIVFHKVAKEWDRNHG